MCLTDTRGYVCSWFPKANRSWMQGQTKNNSGHCYKDYKSKGAPHPGAKTEREAQGRAPGGWALARLGHGDMDYHPQEGQCPSPPERWEKSNLSNAWSWEVLVKCSQAHLKAQLRFCNQTLFHSGVAFSQRQQEGVGLLLSPWPTAWILGFSPVDEKLVSEYL